MRIDVVSVCRRPPAWVKSATDEYAKRLSRDVQLVFSQVMPGRNGMSVAERVSDEGRRLVKAIPARAHVVALDREGAEYSSEEVAALLASWRERYAAVALLIGGADGLAHAVRERSDACWSLSRLTLPHLLVQVLLAEQLYRAWAIITQHPYHRS